MNELNRALRGFGWGHMFAGVALMVLAMLKFPTWMLALEVVINSHNATNHDVAVVLWWPIAKSMSLIQAIAGLTLLLGWKRAWMVMVGWACASMCVNLLHVPMLGWNSVMLVELIFAGVTLPFFLSPPVRAAFAGHHYVITSVGADDA